MKKTLKKVLAVILCIAMMTGTLCMAASAAAKTPPQSLKYVAVGDSASMGYDMDDYWDHFQHNWDERLGSEAMPSSSYSVYARMSDYLENTAKIEDLETKDLSMTGMRSLELRSILDPSYYESHEGEVKTFNEGGTFWGYHMDEYLTRFSDTATADKHRHGWGTYELLNSTYTKFLYDADLITYDLTMNDFGTYLGQRFSEFGKPNFEKETFAQIIKDEGSNPMIKQVTATAENLKLALNKLLAKSELPLDMVEGYLDMFLYCYANFAINFSKNMDFIYTYNPDVDLIVVGPFNVMNNMNFVFGDIKLDASLIWGALNEAVTAWICTVDPHRNQYKLADMSGGCETCITMIANNEWDSYKVATGYYFDELGIYDLLAGAKAAAGEATAAALEATIRENLSKTAKFTDIDLMGVVAKMSEDLTGVGLRVMLNFDDVEEVAAQYAPMLAAVGITGVFYDESGNYIHTSDADRGMMHADLRLIASYALGSHPDAKGYDQKIAAVIKAYESDYAADGTYVARAAETGISFVKAIFNVLLGEKGALQTLKQMILDLFAPITKIFNLVGSFGGK